MELWNVERIVRDVVAAYGWDVSRLSVTPLAHAWCVTLMDTAGQTLSIDVPDGPPARVRAVLGEWLDEQP
jgi:hypothetical protein